MVLKEGERFDNTGFGGLGVIQKKDFGYGVDSVLLAAFAAGETGSRGIKTNRKSKAGNLRVADLGTGNGIVAFIAYHKLCNQSKSSQIQIVGIEKNEEAYDRAVRGCTENNLQDAVSFINTDILDIQCETEFDAILSNPPYFRKAKSFDGIVPGGTGSVDSDRYISRHETTADIWDFAHTASSMLKNGGDFCIVHRPDRLVDIFDAMRASGIEPKEMQLVVPSQRKPANMVLVHGIKGAGPELRVLPEIAVHKTEGGYTDEIIRLYERTDE